MPRRMLLFALALLPGCSNAPIAGTLDCLFPSRLRSANGPADLERLPAPPRPVDPVPPFERSPLPPQEPYPFEDPRRATPAFGDPLSRTPKPAPRPRQDDLPLLRPPVGLEDPLPPPPGVR